MNKNTVIAMVLSGLVIAAAMFVQYKFFPPAPVQQQPSTTASVTEQQAAVPQNTFVAENMPADSAVLEVPDETVIGEQIVTIKTNVAEITFTNRGGDIISYKLLEHNNSKGDSHVEMVKNLTDRNRAFSIALGGAQAPALNQFFNVKEETVNGKQTVGFFKTISIKNQDGSISSFTLAKRYTFLPDDYMFELAVTVSGDADMKGLNFDNAGYTLRTMPQIGPDWDVKADRYEYRNFFAYIDGKKKDATLKANQTKLITDSVPWAGISGKYFSLIVIPSTPAQQILYSAAQPNADRVQDGQLFFLRPVITGNKVTDVYRIYLGPCSENILSTYNIPSKNNYNYDNLRIDTVAVSSGIWRPLEVLLKWLLQFFYKLIPNWGVSIILVTILIKVIFFPLTKKSSESTQQMQKMQPKIKELQEKYKGKPQKLNEEMAKLYKEAGYNPLSGCLPLLIQLPILFAMYRLFNNYFEFRGAMFIPHWIPDLSIGDSVLQFPSPIPFLGWTDLRILPIVYVISQMVFGKITQTPTNDQQQNSTMKIMMYGMPLFFFFMFYNAPSGLLLYWTCTNFLMLVQQMIIKAMMKQKKEVRK
ncbi:membrane protein insertase YidC [Treponema sp. OMZ 803]|jgi:inner membrane protein oxaA|uniref:Membrane protein insertase YidC n=1 Tax=Treponema vincentii TaxID=69710 RepID=A0A6P1XYC8_9SPIR|nr:MULTISPECIES: membrane protein insertase YidC [Treponema]QHX42447.1 membrane protein insertase YidC [Treponema vincentii]UTC53489.1 membrane protein insertase YidC [Treponema sp. OMZ 803]